MRVWLPRSLMRSFRSAALYALVFREPGGRLAPHDAYALRVFADSVFHANRARPCGDRLCARRLAVVLARAGADPDGDCPVAVLLLQDADLAREFLARPPVPDRDSAGRAHLCAAAMFRTRVVPARDDADGQARICGHRCIAALCCWGSSIFSASQPIRTHIEYAGIIPRLEQLAATFADDDLVLFEARAASDVHVLALPLSYIYARNVLVLLRPTTGQGGGCATFLTWAHERYGNVYFVAGGGTDLLSADVGSVVVERRDFRFRSTRRPPTTSIRAAR